jgi:outer membrane protein assembly factor BamA
MRVPVDWRSVARAMLFATAALVCSQTVLAQLPPRLKRCLPYPTFADEIEDAKAADAVKLPAPRSIVIDSVRFQSQPHLPQSLRKSLVSEIKSHSLKDRPGWVSEIGEISVRAPLEDLGYFRADEKVTTRTISESATTEHVALNVSVDLGPQYRLGGVQFRSTEADVPLAFSNEELRKRVLLRDGDLFDVSKVRQTFMALRQLYASAGWVDFSPAPDFRINDASKRINMTLELDQGLRYRIHELQFLGNDAAAEKLIRSNLKVGEPFNGLFLQEFYEANKLILPPGAKAEDDVVIKKNPKQGFVDIRIDLSTCPSNSD